MANQNQRTNTDGTRSNDKRGSMVAGSEDDELVGETEDGVEIEGTLDDDEGGLEAQGSNEADQSGTRSGRGKRGGSGNFANDPQRASEAGRKGGQH